MAESTLTLCEGRQRETADLDSTRPPRVTPVCCGKPNWQLLLECARVLTARGVTPFSGEQLVRCVHQRHPDRGRGSLQPVLQGMTDNARGGPRSAAGTPFHRVARGRYVLRDGAVTPAASLSPRVEPAPSVSRPSDGPVDLVLVGCVKTKRETASVAKDLYVSAMFARRRAYAERAGCAWYILSAEHGLLHPDALVEPYDVYLADQPDDYRRAWGQWVVARLRHIEGELGGRVIEVHASEAYAAAIREGLRGLGAVVREPLRGLRQGQQLAWYDRPAPGSLALGSAEPAAGTDGPIAALEDLVIVDGPRDTGPFAYRWPEGEESFERGWDLVVELHGRRYTVRHGLGWRDAYGTRRRRSVTWIDHQPVAEGVGPDDYPVTRHLISVLRHGDQRLVRPGDVVPVVYRDFPLTDYRHEIRAPYTRDALAVKLPEVDLVSWVGFGLARTLARTLARAPAPARVEPPPARPPAPVAANTSAIVDALLRYGASQAPKDPGAVTFTPHPEANALILDDPFAFLLAVIFDQGIPAERAWRAPYDLRQRLGHLDPARLRADPAGVRAAVAQPPALHRYREKVSEWVVAAAGTVMDDYGGDAGSIWAGTPTAVELQRRLDAFPGIGQKKAAMAVEILERDLGVPIRALAGSDIAYDVHVRRVFLRTGLASYDDRDHMIAVARDAYPQRPGAIDYPAWLVGRRWCHAGLPDCGACVLAEVCVKDISRANQVRGA